MQIFLLIALGISLLALVFALQNNVPVTVAVLQWTFEGSLALVLLVALVAGALIGVLAFVPTLVRSRWAASQHRKQVASLETRLADCEQRLQRADVQPPGASTPALKG